MSTPHPVSEPFAAGRLRVSPTHEIAFRQHGNPDGRPAVYLHGGPGGGCHPRMAGFFHPDKWRVVLPDQRGCGQSAPNAELRENTTWDLVADLETLRQHLGVQKWLVCGGSWGSALALAYAQKHPQSVAALVLRGIFTLRRAELLWFYQEGANWIFPDLWEEFIAPIPPAERGDMIGAHHRRLAGTDEKIQMECARAWSRWEAGTLSLRRDDSRVADFSRPEFALAFARIESHYFVNAGFFRQDGQLIADAGRLAGIPGFIAQGRYDVVTPMRTAWDLHRAWPEAKLRVAPNAGHAADEPEISAALAQAIEDFSRPPG